MACKALGFIGAKKFTTTKAFGKFVATNGKSVYAYEALQCLGNEDDFDKCTNPDKETPTKCNTTSTDNAAGVECYDYSEGNNTFFAKFLNREFISEYPSAVARWCG